MNPREMEQICGEWRQLTEAEGRAIAASDWAEVDRHQQEKQKLQGRLGRVLESRRKPGFSLGNPPVKYESTLPPLIASLISLEKANAQLLVVCREEARAKLAECNRASGILRDLNRTYGTSAIGHWTSYS